MFQTHLYLLQLVDNEEVKFDVPREVIERVKKIDENDVKKI